jgi:hypothetical protein
VNTYTRLTVTGETRRTEVVVASAEPLGSALPRLLDLLGETTGTVARPLTLIGADGGQLDIGRSPQQLELIDGTLLRLVRLDAAPPPPVVIDVTDAAADAHDARGDLWGDRARALAGGTGIALSFAASGFLAPWGSPLAASWWLLGAFVVVLAIGTALGLGGLRRVADCVSAAAAGLIIPLTMSTLTALSTSSIADAAPLAAAAVALAAASTTVLLGRGVSHRQPGAAAGGALGAVLSTLLLVLVLAGLTPLTAAAIAGTLAAFATGPLPWIALSAAGLTDLDRRAAEGDPADRGHAFARIDDAYAALTWSVAAVAALLAVTGVALLATGDLWGALLALAFALVAALRSRAFPLRAQAWALWTAVAAIALPGLVFGLSGEYGWVGAAVGIVAALLIAVAVLARPKPHARARLRGIGNVLETVTLVSLLPLVIGAFGIYGELLGMFGGGS